MMYTQGLDTSPDELMDTHSGQSSEKRNASSKSKRKWGGQMAEMVEVIRNAIEFMNYQLKAIEEWSKEQRQVEVEYGVEVMKQL